MLDPKKEKAINLLIYSKMTDTDIAKEVGVARSTLSNWKKDKSFNERYLEELGVLATSMGAKALNKLIGLLDSENEYLVYQVAKDLLDRIGLKAPEKLETTTTVKTNPVEGLTTEELREILKKDN